MSTEITPQKQSFSLTPQSLDEAMRFAELLSKSSIIPKDYVNNPGNVIVAMQWGMELGLQPMQAMQNIAVINGRPSIWGDAMLAIVRGSGLLESISETATETESTCSIKRKGEAIVTRTFSDDDAKKAGLIGKQGPWTQYPKRMRQLRARAFALRDVFPDVLRGIQVAEEVIDLPKDTGGHGTVIDGSTGEVLNKPAAKPAYSEAQMQENRQKWQAGIDSGKLNPEKIIAAASSKYTLSDEQKAAIRAMTPTQEEEKQAEETVDFLTATANDDQPF